MNKLLIARRMLERGSIFVHVNPFLNPFECQLPLKLKGNRHVVLHVGFEMPKPIPDLFFNDLGFGGTLSFTGQPFYVWVPWETVTALGDENGIGYAWEGFEEPAQAALPDNVVSLDEFRKRKAAK